MRKEKNITPRQSGVGMFSIFLSAGKRFIRVSSPRYVAFLSFSTNRARQGKNMEISSSVESFQAPGDARQSKYGLLSAGWAALLFCLQPLLLLLLLARHISISTRNLRVTRRLDPSVCCSICCRRRRLSFLAFGLDSLLGTDCTSHSHTVPPTYSYSLTHISTMRVVQQLSYIKFSYRETLVGLYSNPGSLALAPACQVQSSSYSIVSPFFPSREKGTWRRLYFANTGTRYLARPEVVKEPSS